jgi:exodeoxyribonuclease VII large subunit
VARHRRDLHQKAREMRAASRRGLDARATRIARMAGTVLVRKVAAALASSRRSTDSLRADAQALDRASDRLTERRAETLARLSAALAAHDPQRTLERGYALALGADGEPLPTAAAIRAADAFDLRMADGTLPARVAADHAPAQPSLLPDSEAG